MKKVYLSKLAGRPLLTHLKNHGFTLHLMTGAGSPVYDAVSTHADIYMCRLGVWDHPQLFQGERKKLARNYPGNIIYNAVCTEKFFIHNLKYTDPELLEAAENWCKPHGLLHLINVPQGYTRCCCLPVDDRSFITSDQGIAKALSHFDAEVLLIKNGHICLPGFDYGFIGGCGGHLPDRTIIFNGDLSAHPDYEKITAFLEDRDVALTFFKEYPLMDIGSILSE